MVIKVKGLTWAPYTSGGEGNAVVYGAGHAEKDLIVRVDQSEERGDVDFYADDHMIDHDNSVSGANVSVEAAKLTDDMLEQLVGMLKKTDALAMTADDAPYVGFGFIHGMIHCGVKTWRAYWYHKVQFSLGQRSFQTKGETIAYQTESLEGAAAAVQLTENGKDEFFDQSLELSSEAAARTWLDGRAGI